MEPQQWHRPRNATKRFRPCDSTLKLLVGGGVSPEGTRRGRVMIGIPGWKGKFGSCCSEKHEYQIKPVVPKTSINSPGAKSLRKGQPCQKQIRLICSAQRPSPRCQLQVISHHHRRKTTNRIVGGKMAQN
ncbi:hypothetical protein MPTK1_2g05840 [Marchantia polymorpha subsp. ruderalis]|uniref:Uncharacterized protein n=1 Tax=Marchantia polymorpha TaxID=3197 RepID=A0A2R6XDI7_MARPO|nr:hypothetical protein MARPO_0021s0040 [Marchantia polymorpha]BBN01238.1 hypothetical protein Mp_2g05840 [Marchantia polymorpha subsp. ruderalis]|eukprot:PTQ44164.1 hypothetical protein MARPO_0021s0040 [Marchantia polymorpha]